MTLRHMQVLPRGMAADVHKKKSWEVPNGSLAPGDGQHTERSESPTPGLAQGTEPGMEHSSPRGEARGAKSSSSCGLGPPQPCGQGEMGPLITSRTHTHTVLWDGERRQGPSASFPHTGDTWTDAARPLFSGAGQEGAMFVHTRSYEDLTSPEDGAAAARSPEERRGEPAEQSSMEQISKDFSELSTQLTGMALDLDEEMRAGKEGKLEPSPQSTRRDSVLSGKEEEDVTMDAWRSHRKHVFVLSEAGKPVYSRYGSEEALSSTMGVMMALVSFLEAEKNAIRSIHAGTTPGGRGWGGHGLPIYVPATTGHVICPQGQTGCWGQRLQPGCSPGEPGSQVCPRLPGDSLPSRWLQGGLRAEEPAGAGGSGTHPAVRAGDCPRAALHLLPDSEPAHLDPAQPHLPAEAEL